MKRTALQIAAVALIASALSAGTAPAFATARAAPTISIAAKSGMPKITGDVLVIWRSATEKSATIKGTVNGGASGEVLRLYAKQFPFTQAPKVVGKMTISGPTQRYSFTVTPGLATRYQARLFAVSTSHTSLAKSPTVAVFVAADAHARPGPTCGRPVCHQTWHLHVFVPPSTLRTEMPKRWFVYFGLNLSRTGKPPPPRILKLGAGNPRVSKPTKINAHEYAVTIKFSFRIGNNGYSYLFFPCQRDTEAKDGLNLPGHHGCGTLKEIGSKRRYLG
jgi:hypothetical protein